MGYPNTRVIKPHSVRDRRQKIPFSGENVSASRSASWTAAEGATPSWAAQNRKPRVPNKRPELGLGRRHPLSLTGFAFSKTRTRWKQRMQSRSAQYRAMAVTERSRSWVTD